MYSNRKASPVVLQRALTWNVLAVARRRGVSSVKQLARLAELDRQTVEGVWEGRRRDGKFAASFEIETLRKLCVALEARPPACFAWSDEPILPWHAEVQNGPPYLVWRVAEIATARGLTPIALAQRARIFYTRREGSQPSMIERIWAGEHQAIYLHTLASLLSVLDLDPGELLVWADH